MDTNTFDDLEPAFVSIESAARFLGISRAMAYEQANRFLDDGDGLRCIRLGHGLLGLIGTHDLNGLQCLFRSVIGIPGGPG